MKSCTKCGVVKPEEDFYLVKLHKPWRHGSCKDCHCAATRAWKEKHYGPAKKKQWRESGRASKYRIKDACFAAYGGYRCACCGETERRFLTLDHINNDGGQWRKEQFGSVMAAGFRTYWRLYVLKFPDGLQVLCMNCNWGKRNTGICPHQERRNDHPLAGVQSSDWKRPAADQKSAEDMISSASKDAAVELGSRPN